MKGLVSVAIVILFASLSPGCSCGSSGAGDPDGAGGGTDGSGTADARPCQTVLCGSPAVCCDTGEECYQGACLTACASGVRCGSGGMTCCMAGDVCLDLECATPGDPCSDSFDCPEGWFCEPTLDRCLPQPTGPLCEVRPDNVTFDVATEWHWTGYSANAAVRNVAVAPAVADVDADGVPEVVFGAYAAGADNTVMLLMLSGSDGAEELAVPTATLNLTRWSGAAVGNLDSDPELEIIVHSQNLGLVALEHDGAIKWNNATGTFAGGRQSYPALANLDADPEPEVVLGGAALDHDGTLLFDNGWIGCNSTWCMSAVADLDMNGVPDIVGGNVAYDATGAVLWQAAGIPDGFPAVADMDMDGMPEVISVSSGNVRALSGLDGTVIFGPIAIPGGGNGGAPTVADFDGDGRPEFATAGRGRYAVYDLDCTMTGDPTFCPSLRTDGILWEKVTQDISSSITGSSVFDFQGDDAAEVVYNDECTLYVYDGATGDTLFSLPNSSRTAAEYPLIVDVDGDNNSEFVVPANDDQIVRDGCASGQHGIRVFGDMNDKWVRTRPVWNQHTYHVTNVQPNGTIPPMETASWLVTGLNNYRQNVQGAGVFNAPDLVVVGLSVDLLPCPAQIRLLAQVANQGSLGVPGGIPVSFFLGTPGGGAYLGTAYTVQGLLPGASESVAFTWDVPMGDQGPWDFYAIVDEDGMSLGTQTECAEDNNTATITDVACDVIE